MTETRSTLIVVDPTVADYHLLLQGLGADAEVVLLDPSQDGIAQITQLLASRHDLASLHIVSHGSEGSLQLGPAFVNGATLGQYAEQLQQWSASFRAGADVLLWGCDVAAGSEGQSFLNQLSHLTRLDIAASTNLTGRAALGGDWTLEAATGEINSSIAFSTQAQKAYTGTLRTLMVDTYTKLRDALLNAQDGDVISITADINVPSSPALPNITADVRILGNSRTINGNGNRIFTVEGGAVRIENLTIRNGRAVGAPGAAGQPGGIGQGGGLRIINGDVTLISVGFENNSASGGRGGDNPGGTGGAGGEGRGGAIAIEAGNLRLAGVTFTGNSVSGGAGGSGATPGAAGSSVASALYIVNASSLVVSERDPFFSGNSGTPVFGSYTKVEVPTATIVPTSPLVTAGDRVSYTVTFSSSVSGVDASDFQVTGTMPGAQIIPEIAGSDRTYTVSLTTGTALTGTVGLELVDDDSIRSTVTVGNSAIAVPLGGTGFENGSTSGEAYEINRTPPSAVAINRVPNAPELTAASSVTYRVVFSTDVRGVTIDDFQPVAPGIAGATVTEVNSISANTYTVTVNTGTGNGTLGLNLVDNDSIENLLGVKLGGTGAGNGSFTQSQTYRIDKTPPLVGSIAAETSNPTNADSVNFTVNFTQDVSGVDPADFALATTGVSNAQITGVTEINSRTYRVSVNTGSGDGSVGLNLRDNDSIRNSLGVPLGDAGNGNGDFTQGQVYTLIKSAPIVQSMTLTNPSPTAAATVNYGVTFTQDVSGVDVRSFALEGIPDAQIIGVTGSGKSYTVSVNTGSGSGNLRLNLVDTDLIRNSIDVPLGGVGAGNGNFLGAAYAVNKQPPRVASISRLESNPINAPIVNFAVIFNDGVSRVDATDFRLATTGVNGASIASVTRVNDSFYNVAVNTGGGDGTIGLDLIDNDSIINSLGVLLGAAGANNGNFVGEVYRIDRTSPTSAILPIAPQARREPVSAITLQFNEAVRGVDLSDLRLTRDGNTINLSRATLTSTDGMTWTLGNLRKLTNEQGDYRLSLSAGDTGVTDLAGNPLATNVATQWSNLVTVKVCDPGIVRRGTRDAETLEGTENSDTLVGRGGDDLLLGLECDDRLNGGTGNDRLDGGSGDDVLLGGDNNDTLVGGFGQDVLNGGSGADRIVFAGNSQATALVTSLADSPDRVRGFNAQKGDRFMLDFNSNLQSIDRPRRLFNAGRVRGRTLEQAASNAYRDKNQRIQGQRLNANEAVFFTWRGSTYLSVNDSTKGYTANRDLVADVKGIRFQGGDGSAGELRVGSYLG